jgi:hypothetical protein
MKKPEKVTMANSGEVINAISNNVEKIFRHMLPGIWVLLAAYWSHRHWFACMDFASGGYLTLLAAIALAVGNAWYVAHRYSLHQFIDWTSYRRVVRKSVTGQHQYEHYADWLSAHLVRSFRVGEKLPAVSNHIHTRSSQIIFLFMTCEIALVFAFGAETCSPFERHARCIRFVSALGMLVAVCQQHFAFKIDVNIANKYGEYATSSEPALKPDQML